MRLPIGDWPYLSIDHRFRNKAYGQLSVERRTFFLPYPLCLSPNLKMFLSHCLWRSQKFQLGASFPFPSLPQFVPFPFTLPFPCPLLFPSLPSLRSRTPKIQSGVWERAVSSPAGSGAEPQPKSNLLHFSFKMRSGGNDFNYFA